MKAIIKSTGEIVDVRRNDEGMYIQDTEPMQWRYPHELEILGYTPEEVGEIRKQYESGIDWEQRRYEIARAAMQGQLSNQYGDMLVGERDFEGCAVSSVEFADALIAELKKGGNNEGNND